MPSAIQVTLAPGERDLAQQTLYDWIRRAHDAIVAYYGIFPVPSLHLRVDFVPGRSGVSQGKTWGYRGALIHISLGQHTTQTELEEDWMLVHEMVHLALPSLGEQQHWLEEGSATYIEPVARVLIRNLTPERIWADMVRDMPQGVPRSSDHGLDTTQTWASTYWGGALYCLLVDVDIRQKTKGEKGLQQAMRGIVEAGGNILAEWPIDRVLRVGDAATGGDSLQTLYKQMGRHHLDVDLPHLWKRLGVSRINGTVAFDPRAPLANVRQAIAS